MQPAWPVLADAISLVLCREGVRERQNMSICSVPTATVAALCDDGFDDNYLSAVHN
jgi:hypothetical protein